jgi:hypothetical protein
MRTADVSEVLRSVRGMTRDVRRALAEHPLHLLGYASGLVDRRAHGLSATIDDLVARPCLETTALLAVFAELITDDAEVGARCTAEVARRSDVLPAWLVELPNLHPHRAMRRTEVLGDGDDLVIGFRFADGAELTLGAYLDQNDMSAITDLVILPEPIDSALEGAAAQDDPDDAFVELDLADARSWCEHGFERARLLPPAPWAHSLALATWLVGLLPAGGSAYETSDWDDDEVECLLDEFFASPPGSPFRGPGHRRLLVEFCETGSGDPSRWSTRRILDILRSTFRDPRVPLEVCLGGPALLRAFVPFAHASSGIGRDLTDDALATIDELGLGYEQGLLEDEFAAG